MKNDNIIILVRTSKHYDWTWKKKYTSITVSEFDTVKKAQEMMYKQRKEDYGIPVPRKPADMELDAKKMIKPGDSFEDAWEIYTVPKNQIGKDIYIESTQL